MMSDVLAAFGWNAGKRRLTKSLAPNAWWIMDGVANVAVLIQR